MSAIKVPSVRLSERCGLQVSKLWIHADLGIILGMMTYGSSEWQSWVLGAQECKDHVKACLDIGINTFDTANVYSNGKSEELLGQALKELNVPREEVVILTKAYFALPKKMNAPISANADYPNGSGLSRKHLMASIDASLKRLQMEYVDVFQCHRFDYNTPIEETMEALHDIVKSGKARYIGMSSCYAYQFAQMQNYAINNNLTPFVSMQNLWNSAYREEEREMMPTLKQFGVKSIPWSPLGRGALTRPLSQGDSTTRGGTDRMIKAMGEGEATIKINSVIEEIAKKRNCSMAQIALAHALSQERISAPIIGSTKLENITDLAKAVDLELTAEEIKSLEEPYQPRKVLGFA